MTRGEDSTNLTAEELRGVKAAQEFEVKQAMQPELEADINKAMHESKYTNEQASFLTSLLDRSIKDIEAASTGEARKNAVRFNKAVVEVFKERANTFSSPQWSEQRFGKYYAEKLGNVLKNVKAGNKHLDEMKTEMAPVLENFKKQTDEAHKAIETLAAKKASGIVNALNNNPGIEGRVSRVTSTRSSQRGVGG